MPTLAIFQLYRGMKISVKTFVDAYIYIYVTFSILLFKYLLLTSFSFQKYKCSIQCYKKIQLHVLIKTHLPATGFLIVIFPTKTSDPLQFEHLISID
jgi:hypothetical protein